MLKSQSTDNTHSYIYICNSNVFSDVPVYSKLSRKKTILVQKTGHLAWCLQPPPAEREHRVCIFPGAAEDEPTKCRAQKMCWYEKDAAAMLSSSQMTCFFVVVLSVNTLAVTGVAARVGFCATGQPAGTLPLCKKRKQTWLCPLGRPQLPNATWVQPSQGSKHFMDKDTLNNVRYNL